LRLWYPRYRLGQRRDSVRHPIDRRDRCRARRNRLDPRAARLAQQPRKAPGNRRCGPLARARRVRLARDRAQISPLLRRAFTDRDDFGAIESSSMPWRAIAIIAVVAFAYVALDLIFAPGSWISLMLIV